MSTKEKKSTTSTSEEENLPKFSKEQLMRSTTYSHKRDVLMALLKDEEMYSHADVQAEFKKFYDKKVN